MAPTVFNFRQQNKVVILTDASVVTPNSNTTELGILLSVSQNTVFANPTGTPANGQTLQLRITSLLSRPISFGTAYQSIGKPLPTVTTGSSLQNYLYFVYNSTDYKWDLVNTTINNFKISNNYLKNPNFAVIQGIASGSLTNSLAIPTATTGYLGETEWWMTSQTASAIPTYAISALNESITFTGATGTAAIYLGQRLESKDANRLKNKTVTLSADISNSLSLPVTWELWRPTTTADTFGTLNTPTSTFLFNGVWNTLPTNTRYSATFTLPSQVDLGLEIRIYVGSQTSGTWVIGKLQLEEGSLATNFTCGSYLEELQKCLRHYTKGYIHTVNGNVPLPAWFTLPVPSFSINQAIAATLVAGGGTLYGAINKTEFGWRYYSFSGASASDYSIVVSDHLP